jgi:hypothetical protein
VKDLIGGGATLVYDSLTPDSAPHSPSSLPHLYYPNHHHHQQQQYQQQQQQQRKEHVRTDLFCSRSRTPLTASISSTHVNTTPLTDTTGRTNTSPLTNSFAADFVLAKTRCDSVSTLTRSFTLDWPCQIRCHRFHPSEEDRMPLFIPLGRQ